MAITFPLAFPTGLLPAKVNWAQQSNVGVGQSLWTYQQQTQANVGQMWQGTVTMASMTPAQAANFRGWLSCLNGREGTFLIGDPALVVPLGSAAVTPGTPVVDGAGQTGQTLNVKTLPLSATGYLLRGSYLQIGNRLYNLREDVNTDGAGKAALSIWPRLRESPANGAAITLNNCVGTFRLASNNMPADIDSPYWYAYTFGIGEAL